MFVDLENKLVSQNSFNIGLWQLDINGFEEEIREINNYSHLC